VTDATILIPTFRHAALLPYSLRSALEQDGVAVEAFVVGDGVEDDTRSAIEPFLGDERVRFFDFPKGQRHGERHRHDALQHASGAIVCYLSDDDLLLPGHVRDMLGLLENADFAHSAPFVVHEEGRLWFHPIDVARPEFQALLRRGGWNAIVLSGAAHTLDAYRRLPHGWRPAPTGTWTDLYMWQQFLRLPGFRGRTSDRLTHLHFPDNRRKGWSVEARVAELESWRERIGAPGFEQDLERECADEVRRVAVRGEVRVHELKSTLAEVQATRWWRLRTRLATFAWSRARRATRRAAR
jgi:GalNAc5-diNAcBac-PP-undecaprenol beta-1,3-glucosyltransferase